MRNVLILGALVTGGIALSAQAQEWRAQYSVGQQVSFTISGRASDLQTCTVVENEEGSVMRVRCGKFKSWSAGTYIVYDDENIRPLGSNAPVGRPAPRKPVQTTHPSPRPAGPAAAGTLKTGEYACYGSGGRIMIGLGFKVTGPGRYTDLEGGNAGRFTVANGQVRFTGGHMGGQTGQMVGGHDFRIGMKARCEPY